MARGGYTFDQISAMSEEEIAFLHHYQSLDAQEHAHDMMVSLGLMFGVLWDTEVDYNKERVGSPSKYLATPLTMVTNPQYISTVLGKKSKPQSSVHPGDIPAGMQVKSFEDMNTDEAKAFLKAAGIYRPKSTS